MSNTTYAVFTHKDGNPVGGAGDFLGFVSTADLPSARTAMLSLINRDGDFDNCYELVANDTTTTPPTMTVAERGQITVNVHNVRTATPTPTTKFNNRLTKRAQLLAGRAASETRIAATPQHTAGKTVNAAGNFVS
jgi:hypothetical protein